MRFAIAVDMEGLACVVGRPEIALGTDHHYDWARGQATREANAAARGLFDAGAEQVVIWDNHGTGVNLYYDQIDPRCDIMMGSGMARRWGGAIEGFDGVLMIGYHAMDNTPGAVLAHTFSSRDFQWMRMGGTEVGELAIDGAVAGAMGVPVILVASDEAGAAEGKRFFPWAETVATKRALGWNAALSHSPQRVCDALYEAAKRAVKRLDEMQLLNLREPIAYQIRYTRLESAERAANEGWRRIDAYTVEKTITSLMEVF